MAAWVLETPNTLTQDRFNGFAANGRSSDQFLLWDKIKDDLLRIRNLDDDWDGLGATSPSTALVDSAVELLHFLRKAGISCPSGVAPGMNGTVIVEWQHEGVYMEAEVTKPYHSEWMLAVPGQPTQHWTSR